MRYPCVIYPLKKLSNIGVSMYVWQDARFWYNELAWFECSILSEIYAEPIRHYARVKTNIYRELGRAGNITEYTHLIKKRRYRSADPVQLLICLDGYPKYWEKH